MKDINKQANNAIIFFGYCEKLNLIQQIKILYWYRFNKKKLVEVFDNLQRGKSIKDSFKQTHK